MTTRSFTPARRGRRGGALTTALAAAAVAAAFAVIGFYLGRFVLGEQYLKRGAARLKPQPSAYVAAQPGPPTEQLLIEEPPPPEPERPAPAVERRDQPEPAPARPPSVTLQLGFFLDPANAKILVQDLRNRGYSPTVTAEKHGESTGHRVTMGPLPPERAAALAQELRREGYEVMIPGERQ